MFLNQSYFKHVKGVSKVRSQLNLSIYGPFPNFLLFSDFFPSIFYFLCHESEVEHCLCCNSKSHITIWSSVKVIAKDGTLSEQVVEKSVLWRQTRKRTTVCFDQLCSKITPEVKYKRNCSTRKIVKNLQAKNIEVSSIKLMR